MEELRLGHLELQAARRGRLLLRGRFASPQQHQGHGPVLLLSLPRLVRPLQGRVERLAEKGLLAQEMSAYVSRDSLRAEQKPPHLPGVRKSLKSGPPERLS